MAIKRGKTETMRQIEGHEIGERARGRERLSKEA